METVFSYGGRNFFVGAKTESLIQVDQKTSGKRFFTVTYGLQQKTHLSYDEAVREIGIAILHHACCEGLASNEGA